MHTPSHPQRIRLPPRTSASSPSERPATRWSLYNELKKSSGGAEPTSLFPPKLDKASIHFLQGSPSWLKGTALSQEIGGIYAINEADKTIYGARSFTGTKNRVVDLLTLTCDCPRIGLCGHLAGVAQCVFDKRNDVQFRALAQISYIRELIKRQGFPRSFGQIQKCAQTISDELRRKQIEPHLLQQVYLCLLVGAEARRYFSTNTTSPATTSSDPTSPKPPIADLEQPSIPISSMTVDELANFLIQSSTNPLLIARSVVDEWRAAREIQTNQQAESIFEPIGRHLQRLYGAYLKQKSNAQITLDMDRFIYSLLRLDGYSWPSFFANQRDDPTEEAKTELDYDVTGPLVVSPHLLEQLRTNGSVSLLSRLTEGIALSRTQRTVIDLKEAIALGDYEKIALALIDAPATHSQFFDWVELLETLPVLDDYNLRRCMSALNRWATHPGFTQLRCPLRRPYAEMLRVMIAHSAAGERRSPASAARLSKTTIVSPQDPGGGYFVRISPVINSPDKCYQHIQRIREHEYGLTPVVDDSSVRVAERKRLTRAIAQIAREIYSTQTRVLWELLQNADDCDYSESARLLIIGSVAAGGVLICTNEVGFQPSHVDAICDIARSSKDDSKTGKFGMGFKSVFLVTDEPCVLSNNYSFGFVGHDELREDGDGFVKAALLPGSDPTLPYCCPYWISCQSIGELVPAAIRASLGERQYTTYIWLPVSSVASKIERMRTFIAAIQNIEAREVLFLQKLGLISYVCPEDAPQRTLDLIIRRDSTSTVTRRSIERVDVSGSKIQTYMIFERNMLEVGVLLSNDGEEAELDQGWLYCTFPISATGLAFHINSSHFCTTGSREKLKSEDPRNSEILSSLTLLVADMVLPKLGSNLELLPLAPPLTYCRCLDVVLAETAEYLSSHIKLPSLRGVLRPLRELCKLDWQLTDENRAAVDAAWMEVWPGEEFDLLCSKNSSARKIQPVGLHHVQAIIKHARDCAEHLSSLLTFLSLLPPHLKRSVKYCHLASQKVNFRYLRQAANALDDSSFCALDESVETMCFDQIESPVFVLASQLRLRGREDLVREPVPATSDPVASAMSAVLSVISDNLLWARLELSRAERASELIEVFIQSVLHIPVITLSDTQSLRSLLGAMKLQLRRPILAGASVQPYIRLTNKIIEANAADLLDTSIIWVDEQRCNYVAHDLRWAGDLQSILGPYLAAESLALHEQYRFDVSSLKLLGVKPSFRCRGSLNALQTPVLRDAVEKSEDLAAIASMWQPLVQLLDDTYVAHTELEKVQDAQANILTVCNLFEDSTLYELLRGVMLNPKTGMLMTDSYCRTPTSDPGSTLRPVDDCVRHFPVYSTALMKLLTDSQRLRGALQVRITPSADDYLRFLGTCQKTEVGFQEWISCAVRLGEQQALEESSSASLATILVKDCAGNIRRRATEVVCLSYPSWFTEIAPIVPGLLCHTEFSSLTPLRRFYRRYTQCAVKPTTNWATAVLETIRRLITKNPLDPFKLQQVIAYVHTIMICAWVLKENQADARQILSSILRDVSWIPIEAFRKSAEVLLLVPIDRAKDMIFGFGDVFEEWRDGFVHTASLVPTLIGCELSANLPEAECWRKPQFMAFAYLFGTVCKARWFATAARIRDAIKAQIVAEYEDPHHIGDKLARVAGHKSRVRFYSVADEALRIKYILELATGEAIKYRVDNPLPFTIFRDSNDDVNVYLLQPELVSSETSPKRNRHHLDLEDLIQKHLEEDNFLLSLSAVVREPNAPDPDIIYDVASLDLGPYSKPTSVRRRTEEPSLEPEFEALSEEEPEYKPVAYTRKTMPSPPPTTAPPEAVAPSRQTEPHEISSLVEDWGAPSPADLNHHLRANGRSIRGRSIGLAGERIILETLEAELRDTGYRAHWLNSAEESYKPYDIVILDECNEASAYIEVKATVRSDWAFYLSSAELNFAARMRQKYIVYCLKDMTQAKPNLRVFRNIYEMISAKEMKMMMIPAT